MDVINLFPKKLVKRKLKRDMQLKQHRCIRCTKNTKKYV